MKYSISDHILKRIKQRESAIKEVEECIKYPDQIVSGEKERLIYQKMLPLNGKRKMLRVVVEQKDDSIRAITMYKTSKIKKYWREEV